MLKKTRLAKKILIFLMYAGTVFVPNFVFALEAGYPTIFGLSLGDNTGLPEYAKYFFNIGIISAGILAALVIAFGGIYYLVDFGRGKAGSEGTEWIKAGLAGLLLIMCAYLIAYTINPYLVIFDLKGLAPLTFLANLFETPSPSLPIEIYREIPIGTLTENLLTRQIDCYDFDGNGDFIEGKEIKTDDKKTYYGPTYLKHDRADCFLMLAEAIKKKSETANKLAEKIADLMVQCQCSSGESTCWKIDKQSGKIKIDDPVQSSCESALSPGDCEKGTASKASCEKITKNCKSSGDCELCSKDIIKKREQGPIELESDESIQCITSKSEYDGLNEFRSEFNNNYDAIKNVVEIQPQPQLEGKNISIINNGSCAVCSHQCPTCKEGDTRCLNEQTECEAKKTECLGERKKCLQKNSPWHKLRLIDQLMYLKGKAEEMKQKVQQDVSSLKNAEEDLGNCYLADSYVDFLKTYEQTDKEKKTIVVEQSFSDSETSQPVNPAKYCEGFQYSNSECYSQCQKVCPGNLEKDIECYKKAGPDCSDKTGNSLKNCLKEQALNVEKCYNNRICIKDASPYGTFQECMEGCKQQCTSSCSQKCSSNEKEECEQNCNEDSECLLNNAGKCLFDFNELKVCSDPSECISDCKEDDGCIETCKLQYQNIDFIQNCIESSASLCKYCSDQYAGYPDCVVSSAYKDGSYSSSYICKNPDQQVCQYPHGIFDLLSQIASGGFSDDEQALTITTCSFRHLETAKCPADSKCPACPCDIVGEDDESSKTPSCSPNQGEKSNIDENAEYRVCSPECDSYAFNDDPLTFYCSQTWWKKEQIKTEKPLGTAQICPKENEIPVGQTVDDAEKWGQNFLDAIKDFTQKADDMVEYLKKIGQEENYCKCGSLCAPGETACQSRCEFIEGEDSNSNSCTLIDECSGNPCQKIINLLLGKEEGNKKTNNKSDACPKGTEEGFKGVKWHLEQIKDSFKKIQDFVEKDKRSDILKELEYSRQGINSCSTNYSKETRVLSCTRVEHEIMSPIIGSTEPGIAIINNKATSQYCYGKELGAISGDDPVADNWFCCQNK